MVSRTLSKLSTIDLIRFWSNVSIPDDAGPDDDRCWNWIAGSSEGYGSFSIAGEHQLGAHVAARFIATAEQPLGLMTCHKCDNRRCCNPKHLFLGTRGDNNRDRARKGRSSKGQSHYSKTRPERLARGSKNGSSKLREADVVEILKRVAGGESRRSVAKNKGVSRVTIDNIVNGKKWAHVR